MIPVTKYHGCGNDFIITDWELLKHKNIEDFVKHVCDRHTGIGADGCILVKQKPLEMVFYNADGSRAPMCGNGIRCFAKYCYDEGIETAEEYDVETLAGSKHVTRVSLKPFQVRIDMGTWDDDPKSIQVDTLKEPVMGYELCIGDKAYRFTASSCQRYIPLCLYPMPLPLIIMRSGMQSVTIPCTENRQMSTLCKSWMRIPCRW